MCYQTKKSQTVTVLKVYLHLKSFHIQHSYPSSIQGPNTSLPCLRRFHVRYHETSVYTTFQNKTSRQIYVFRWVVNIFFMVDDHQCFEFQIHPPALFKGMGACHGNGVPLRSNKPGVKCFGWKLETDDNLLGRSKQRSGKRRCLVFVFFCGELFNLSQSSFCI